MSSPDPRCIGPYKLLRELGSGAEGTVWLCEDLRLNRVVALKVLASTAATLVKSGIPREALIASRLDHPGICAVLDAGEIDGIAFVAMRYVEGTTLAEQMESAHRAGHRLFAEPGIRPAEARMRVLRLFESLARALHTAHEAGVVHGDIKPKNIVVTLGREPVVLDFGVARHVTDRVESGQAGTPQYMAPELLRGKGAQVDRRADIWSLGLMLKEALVGDPAGPGNRDPALSRDLDAVIARCLHSDLGLRYCTALELAEDLFRLRTYQPVAARNATLFARSRLWTKREPRLAASLVLTFLAVLGAAVISSVMLARETRAHAEAELQVTRLRKLSSDLVSVVPSALTSSGATSAREIVVSKALIHLEALARERPSDRHLELELMQAYLSVGNVQGDPLGASLADPLGAIATWTKAIALGREAVRHDPLARAPLVDLLLRRAETWIGEFRPTAAAVDLQEAGLLLEGGPEFATSRLWHSRLLAQVEIERGAGVQAAQTLLRGLQGFFVRPDWAQNPVSRLQVARSLRMLSLATLGVLAPWERLWFLELAGKTVGVDAPSEGFAALELAATLVQRSWCERNSYPRENSAQVHGAATRIYSRLLDGDASNRSAAIGAAKVAVERLRGCVLGGFSAQDRLELERIVEKVATWPETLRSSGAFQRLECEALFLRATFLEDGIAKRLPLMRRAVALCEDAHENDPTSITTLGALVEQRKYLSGQLFLAGHDKEAETEVRELIATVARSPAQNAALRLRRDWIVHGLMVLGAIAADGGRSEEAIRHLEGAFELATSLGPEKSLGPNELKSMSAIAPTLATALVQAGRSSTGKSVWNKVLACWRSAEAGQAGLAADLELLAIEDLAGAATFHFQVESPGDGESMLQEADDRLVKWRSSSTPADQLALHLAKTCQAVANGCAVAKRTDRAKLWLTSALDAMEAAARLRHSSSDPDRHVCGLVKKLLLLGPKHEQQIQLRRRWIAAMERICSRANARPEDLFSLGREKLESRETALQDPEGALALTRRLIAGGTDSLELEHVLLHLDATERTGRVEDGLAQISAWMRTLEHLPDRVQDLETLKARVEKLRTKR